MDIACKDCPKCSEEEMSKNYESDNEDEDKWSNMEKACWSGYTQRGMKEKNGRMVPNCVPVEKSYHEDEKPKKEMKKSIWDGAFLKQSLLHLKHFASCRKKLVAIILVQLLVYWLVSFEEFFIVNWSQLDVQLLEIFTISIFSYHQKVYIH